MITDTSADARKVDKRTAAALWDAVVLPSTARRRHEEEADESTMTFTLVTKRGAKQQVRAIDVPAEAPLAVQTRSAQRQDKEEQQHLKRLVLDYEQREEAEERKGWYCTALHRRLSLNGSTALENQSRFGGMKIRFVG
jgi:regulator of nonsense transcripts 2